MLYRLTTEKVQKAKKPGVVINLAMEILPLQKERALHVAPF
jgi:hypothetical protein